MVHIGGEAVDDVLGLVIAHCLLHGCGVHVLAGVVTVS